MRTVLIGFGRIGAAYADDARIAAHYQYASHAQALRDHPGFVWNAVVDPAESARADARTRWGISHCVADVREAGEHHDAEVAVIATPPESRLDLIRHLPALRAVLVEKPLGTDEVAAREFLSECERRNILVQVNLWRRADALSRRLAAGLLRRTIGEVQTGFGVYGNGLINNGTHLIDYVRMLVGEVAAVRCTGPGSTAANFPVRDDMHAAFSLELTNGATVALHPVKFDQYREIALDLWGTNGRLSILNEGLHIRSSARVPHRALAEDFEIDHATAQSYPSTAGRALYEMYENLAGALRGADDLVSPGHSALRTAGIVDAVRRAIAGEDRVTVPA